MKNKKTSLPNKPIVNQTVTIGVLAGILLLIVSVTLWNAGELRSVLNRSTEKYALDVTSQLASDLSARMEHHMDDLVLLADSITTSAYTDEELTAYLPDQAKKFGFDALFAMDRDGNILPEDSPTEDLAGLSGLASTFSGESAVHVAQGQNMLYATPLRSGGVVTGILVGIRNKENVQALIQPKNFDGHGLTCIVDDQGQVVVSPTDLKPFLRLDNIFKSGAATKEAKAVVDMKENIRDKRDGVFQFTAVDGNELILSYNALTINDWVLLTIIPADLIAGEADGYLLRTLIIIGGIVVVFFLFLATLFHFYRSHRKHLEQIAFVDPITGGNNNAAFQWHYQEIVGGAPPAVYTVVLMNLAGFKLINENFGTAAGDDTLRHLYGALLRHTRDGEFAARGAADNFFLCVKESDPASIQKRLDDIVRDINAFNDGRETPYYLTLTFGACLVEDPGLEATIIQDRARTAYQRQRTDGQADCVFYDAGFTKRLRTEKELLDHFDQAIDRREFLVYLQPKVWLDSGKVAGAEALVRWRHPQNGLIAPSDFIPLFERSGKIRRLDLYMFEEVCALLQRWQEEGEELVPISVNLSRQHCKDPDFLQTYRQIADRYRIPSGIIEFELTESMLFDNQQIQLVKGLIKQMHAMGFLCSLDDFGSGFSSLGLLKEFDVDAIKLDRQFFSDMSGVKSRDVIACLIELSKKLDVRTVAEGIETREQLDFLRAERCDMVQGYVFSKPLSLPDFERWRRERPD